VEAPEGMKRREFSLKLVDFNEGFVYFGTA
jgi:hypothetical protein